MKQIWIVQPKDDRCFVDAYDNEAAARDCADFYRGWILKCYSVNVESEFTNPNDWGDDDD
ncbi:hypothetical protein G6677_07890 [Polynucleobacter paneuropaeus]|nr:hypothetical protein [Polynucleobacter paneuropaeus]